MSRILKYFFSNQNPKVFFDIAINGAPQGRITFELFQDTVPKTATNFLHLCIGDKVSETSKK